MEQQNEYTCEICNNTYKYVTDWTDEEAKKEYKENFPEESKAKEEKGIVCDSCYNEYIVEINN